VLVTLTAFSPAMPRRRKLRRVTPSDEQILRPITDPGLMKAIGILLALLLVLGSGVFLVVRGLG
jgi:hypothetical protein